MLKQSEIDEVIDLAERMKTGCSCNLCAAARLDRIRTLLQANETEPVAEEVEFSMGGLYRERKRPLLYILSYGGDGFQFTELDGCRYQSASNLTRRMVDTILRNEMEYLGKATQLLKLPK